jgi:hypothetical protein
MSMNEIFLELLKYVPFIKDEAVKIQRYLSGLPPSIGDKIQYDDPKTMEETIRRAKCLYEQQREKPTFWKAWDDQKRFKKEQRQKGDKPSFFINSLQGQPSFRETRRTKEGAQRQILTPIQCWGYQGNHKYRDCPHKMVRQELYILFNKLKQWRIWVAECRGSTQPWITSKQNFNHT